MSKVTPLQNYLKREIGHLDSAERKALGAKIGYEERTLRNWLSGATDPLPIIKYVDWKRLLKEVRNEI